jgi:hypothetical protein
MALDWVGVITKVFGAIGQRILRQWLFELEPIGGHYVVYSYERGDAPFISVWFSVRVHNRNSSPTTLYAERLTVELGGGREDDFPLPSVAPYGDIDSLFEQGKSIAVGASSTFEVAFASRKHHATLPEYYLSGQSLDATIGIAETFGNHREVRVQLDSKGVVKQ